MNEQNDHASLIPSRSAAAPPALRDPRLPLRPEVTHHATATGAPAITVGAVLHTARRWWKVATPLGLLLGGLAAAAVWYFFVPQFMATRWIQIRDQSPYIVFAPSTDGTRYSRTQMGIITNRIVLDPVVARPEIARLGELQGVPSPADWLGSRIQTTSINGSELHSVSFEGPNPDHAVKIVNAVVEEYIKVQREEGEDKSKEIQDKLRFELQRRKSDVQLLREEVAAAAKLIADQQMVVPGLRTLVELPSQFALLQSELTTLEVDRTVFKARYDALADQLKSFEAKVSEDEIQQGIAADPRILSLYQLIAQAEAQLDNRETIGAPGREDRYAATLRRTIAAYEEQVNAHIEEITPRVKEAIQKQRRADLEEQLASLSSELEEKKLRVDQMLLRIEKEREKLIQKSDQSMDLEFKQQELAQQTEVYERIADRIETMVTERDAPARVIPFPEARQAEPTKEHKVPRLVMAGAAGFVLPFFLAVLWEMKTRRIGASDEIHGETPVRVVGEISAMPTRPSRLRRRTGSHYTYYRNTFEESIDYLRTSLLLSDDFHDIKVLAVASAVSREGKTSLASHLAVSVARATKESTLLIDADLRKPGIHDLFDVALSPGLAQLLGGQCQFDEVLAIDSMPHLHIMPAGELATNPHVLLGNGALTAVLNEARERYRYIIVDSPPVLPVSDALVIAKACDATLISTMRDVSRGPQVRRACERLKAAGANLIGAVLSGVPPQRYASHYGSYSYEYRQPAANPAPPPDPTVQDTV